MKIRLPERVITKGRLSSVTVTVGFVAGGAAGASPDFGAAAGVGSGVTETGGSTVGKNFSSLGVNFAASSLVGNSIAVNIVGTSVRAGQVANISREFANASEFFFRKFTTDLNS